MLRRDHHFQAAMRSLARNPITTILGPRQCGKTTLAKAIHERQPGLYLDLENPEDALRLENPMRTLEARKGLVIIDEVQRRPELFPALRVLADRPGTPARFLLLGCASPDLMRGVSESLAGRVGFVDMSGFNLGETGPDSVRTLWVRGGFPRSYLAADEEASAAWRADFIRTFLERDLPQLGVRVPAETLRRFWMMLAHLHGQVWNAAELARSLGTAENTARHYLDLLCGAFMARRLQPWHENIGKRQIKSPKVYLRDSGVLHALLRIGSYHDLSGHPVLGSSWEGFVLEQIAARWSERDLYFWRTQHGAELDVLLFHGGRRFGFEIKHGDAPRTTRSMHAAVADLSLERLYVVHPGASRFELHDRMEALPVSELMRFELPA